MKGMGRLFQGAATVDSILRGDLIEAAAEAGLRSLFVGFESLDENNLHQSQKHQNLGRDYAEAIRRLHSLGIMINGSFVFGLDSDGPDVFERTVDWAVTQGLTTATFHVLTPYPGTGQFQQIESEGRLLHRDWRLYDTRHAVYRPLAMTPDQLETGYWKAYDYFYSWANVCKGASTHDRFEDRARHFAYTAGWKKFEGAWNAVIRARRLTRLRPALERILTHHRASVPGDQREDRGEIAPIERRPQPPSNTEAPSGSWVGVPAEPIPQGSRLVGDEGGSHERVVLLPTKAR